MKISEKRKMEKLERGKIKYESREFSSEHGHGSTTNIFIVIVSRRGSFLRVPPLACYSRVMRSFRE